MSKLRIFQTGWCLAAVAALMACEQPVPDPLDPDGLDWTSYANDDLGFRMEAPARYRVRVEGNSVVFADGNRTAVRVTHADRSEARNRGLWAQVEPLEQREYGRTTGRFYRYKHWDGPSFVPTLAYVVRHRGKELGIEFRTRQDDLDDVHQHVLETLELIG